MSRSSSPTNDGSFREASAAAQPGKTQPQADGTAQAFHESEVTVQFLRLVNESTRTRDLVRAVTTFFQQQSGCDAVGVRLQEEGDYPYFEARGFPSQFVQAENYLCSRDLDGQVRRDSQGNPALDCMCGNVICGRFDPTKPFFTPQGSFWTNSTTELLATTREADRQSRTRNRCHSEGYESVALIPLRVGDQRLGLLQLNARRKEAFSREIIALWERLGGYLAVALAKLRAEEALRASEARFRSLFENMLEGFAYCRMLFEQGRPQDFTYLHVNDAFGRLTGLKDVVGRRVTEVIPGIRDTDAELFEIYGRVAATGRPEKFETYVKALKMWFAISVYCPAPEHFVAVFDVITARKEGEQALRESEMSLRETQRIARVGSYVLHIPSGVWSSSDVLDAVFGIDESYEHSVEGWTALIHPEDRTMMDDYFRSEVLGQGRTFDKEYRIIRHKDQAERWVHGFGKLEFDAEGHPLRMHGTIQDVTERKLAEESIRRLNLELEERVRQRTAQLEASNQELEAFSYSVSHDLRAPLRAIDGFALILVADYGSRLDEEGLRIAGVIRRQAARMAQLIDDLLTFSRVGRVEAQPVKIDMTSLARTVFEECVAGAADRKIRLKLNSLLPVRCDPSLIRQVLVNLISNAVKYTGPRAEAEIELDSRVEGNQNVYWIKDNGVGFDQKYAGKLFGIFQRLHSDEEFEGTGAGLALVRRIIGRHGGRVWAEGKPQEGAVFYFALPNDEA